MPISTIGTNGLGANAVALATQTSGVLPKAALPSGCILQIIQTAKTDTFTSAAQNTWTDITGMSATITPTASTSRVMVQINMFGVFWRTGNNACILRLLRNGTNVGGGDASGSRGIGIGTSAMAAGTDTGTVFAYNWIDSPATTSALTYRVQFFQDTPANPIYVNRTVNDFDATIWVRTLSTITLTEIAG